MLHVQCFISLNLRGFIIQKDFYILSHNLRAAGIILHKVLILAHPSSCFMIFVKKHQKFTFKKRKPKCKPTHKKC